MAAGNMTLDVLVRLRDLMSGPLRRLTGAVRGFTSIARNIGIVGAAVAAISFTAPIAGAADFQQGLIDIAQTADLSGKAAFDFASTQKRIFEDLALATGIASNTIKAGYGQMQLAGLDKSLVDGSIGMLARVTRAANADFSDIANVGTASLMTLKTPIGDLEKQMAEMIIAGKLGAFELKDMAQFFPSLTPKIAKFGETGLEASRNLAAMLEVSRMGTSDASSAANNLGNFLDKITAPETIKRFADAGVDIPGVLADAAIEGISPVEAVLKKIVDLTSASGVDIGNMLDQAKANGLSGADAVEQVREQLEKIHGATALGELFSDQQASAFLVTFLANVNTFKDIREQMANADISVIDDGFKTQMQGLQAQFTIFKEIGTQATREVGLAFGEWLPKINEHLKAGIQWLRAFNDETNGAVHEALKFGGAATLLAAGLGILGFVLPPLIAGLKLLAAPFTGLAKAVGWLTAVLWGPLVAGLSAIGGFLASISAPVWAVVGAIAAVALAVWHYWEPIKNFVSGFSSVIWDGVADWMGALSDFASWAGGEVVDLAQFFGIDTEAISSRLSDARATVEGWWAGLKSWFSGLNVWSGVKSIFSMKDYSDEAEADFRDAGAGLATSMVDAIKAVVSGLFDWFGDLGNSILQAGGFDGTGAELGRQLMDGVTGKIDELVNWFRGLGRRILDAIGSVDLSSLISFPKVPAWLGGGGDQTTNMQMAPQVAPAQSGSIPSGSIDLNISADPSLKVQNKKTSIKGGGIKLNTGVAVGMP